MDIEQLKLILEMLGKSGEGAYTIGLLWITYPFFSSALACLTVLGVFSLIGYVIIKIIGTVQSWEDRKSSNTKMIGNIKELLPYSGGRDWYEQAIKILKDSKEKEDG